jgi:hypothetical protein
MTHAQRLRYAAVEKRLAAAGVTIEQAADWNSGIGVRQEWRLFKTHFGKFSVGDCGAPARSFCGVDL